MINHFLKSISFIFHPLFMPLSAVIFYYSKSPRYFSKDIFLSKLFSVFIFTIVLPICIYSILKILGTVKSVFLHNTKERILPLILNSFIILFVLQNIFNPSQNIELHYFFIGALISTILCLILAIFKFKASIHMIAISGLFIFFTALSIHFNININGTLALMSILTGAIATSRLHLNAHTYRELIIGCFIGAIPQLILSDFWL